MKLYRVSYATDHSINGSNGFSWHASKRDAEGAVKEYREGNPDEQAPEIEPVTFDTTRDGLLRLLNKYADHPDNG